ncbi:endospore germination permease [Paenibacillus sp. YYML68]|uniref:GerAB/ArcD/ProY family transporter n=1 Tax=Paenibacillus sp. YYML68 TaxID=2909250 RepID=UPI00249345D4|nr:endospore germination permease [Paenibacillus sp. YYML68]
MEQQLSNRQIVLIGSSLVLNTTLISAPMLMTKAASQSAIFGYVLPLLVVGLCWLLLARTMARYPGRDLFQAMTTRFGKLGKLVIIAYGGYFFLILTRDMRSIVDFVSYSLLPTTPGILLALAVGASLVFISRGSLTAVGRMTEIYQTFLIIVICMLPFALAKEIEINNTRPFLETGIYEIATASFYAYGYIGELCLLPFLITAQPYPRRAGLLGLLLGIGLLQLLIVLCMTVMNPDLTSQTVYPNYHLIREIRITDFLDRFDLAIVGIWLPAAIVRTSIILYLICRAVVRVVPQMDEALTAAPVALAAVVGSIWFYESYLQLMGMMKRWPLITVLFTGLMPVLLYLFLRPKKAGSSSGKHKPKASGHSSI